jgi:hypothetical protein
MMKDAIVLTKCISVCSSPILCGGRRDGDRMVVEFTIYINGMIKIDSKNQHFNPMWPVYKYTLLKTE